jgi:hypothetical protein
MNHKPLAVKLIAFYLWLKAAALILSAISAYLYPSVQSTANGVIEDLVPMIMAWREPAHDIWLALLFALVDATLGIGIWFLQKWARIIIVIDLTWLFGRAAVGLLMIAAIHPNGLHFRNPSPYFSINIVASLFILCGLLDPDVMRVFGKRGGGWPWSD